MTKQQALNNSKFFKDITPTTREVWQQRILTCITDNYRPESTLLLKTMIRHRILARAKPYSRLYTLSEEATSANITYRNMNRHILRNCLKW